MGVSKRLGHIRCPSEAQFASGCRTDTNCAIAFSFLLLDPLLLRWWCWGWPWREGCRCFRLALGRRPQGNWEALSGCRTTSGGSGCRRRRNNIRGGNRATLCVPSTFGRALCVTCVPVPLLLSALVSRVHSVAAATTPEHGRTQVVANATTVDVPHSRAAFPLGHRSCPAGTAGNRAPVCERRGKGRRP